MGPGEEWLDFEEESAEIGRLSLTLKHYPG